MTGKPYAQVLSKNILQPLRMLDTGYDLPATILPKRAAGYAKSGTSYANTPYLDMSVPYAAGSLYSAVGDLYKWDQALYTNQLLSAASKAQLLKPYRNNYAYAWIASNLMADQDTVALLSHGGRINGFGSYLLRTPKDRRLVVVLDNEGGAHSEELSLDLLRVLYQLPTTGPKPKPAAPKAIAVNAATLAGYVGKYALAPAFHLAITVATTQLYI